jgi:phospholipase/carboxylesterase
MLATDTVLRTDQRVSGLVILSGSLICAEDWSALAPRRAGLPVFQSHGNADPILPLATADRLRETLTAGKLAVEYHPFSGGHGIPRGVLAELAAFIGRHSRSPA